VASPSSLTLLGWGGKKRRDDGKETCPPSTNAEDQTQREGEKGKQKKGRKKRKMVDKKTL